jgi:hypothetical protein
MRWSARGTPQVLGDLILECFFADRPIRDEYLIVAGGALAGTGAHSYTAGPAKP